MGPRETTLPPLYHISVNPQLEAFLLSSALIQVIVESIENEGQGEELAIVLLSWKAIVLFLISASRKALSLHGLNPGIVILMWVYLR